MPREEEFDRKNPEHIKRLLEDPNLRWADVVGGDVIAELAMMFPKSQGAGNLLFLNVMRQTAELSKANNPFYAQYPPKGQLPEITKDRIPICKFPNEDVLSMTHEALTRNILIPGTIGTGKTNLLRSLIISNTSNGEQAVASCRKYKSLIPNALLLTSPSLPYASPSSSPLYGE